MKLNSVTNDRRSFFGLAMCGCAAVAALVALSLVGIQTSNAAISEDQQPPMIADDSKWEFKYTDAAGAVQPGKCRLEDGLIYHLDAPQSVGKVYQDDQGFVHLEFYRHRKISGGEAVIQKVKNGHWKGLLYFNNQTYDFSMKRL